MTRDRTDADLDLMLAYDGEVDESRAAELLAADEERAEGLGELTELLRGTLETRTDESEDALSGLWERVERRIHSNGASEAHARPAPVAEQEAPSPAVRAEQEAPSPAARAEQDTLSLGERVVAWFIGHRGHFVTGAVSAAAVALLMIGFGPERQAGVREVTVQRPVKTAPTKQPVKAATVVEDESTPPEVESLEVYQGSGTILTLPGEDGEADTSVIWLTPADAEDTMEGPI